MDAQLKALLAEGETISAGVTTLETQIRFADPETGELELLRCEDDPTPRSHTLKPLSELYGQGTPGASVDPQSEHYMSLFLAIRRSAFRPPEQATAPTRRLCPEPAPELLCP
jgi:hypothetical protein